ncbi:ABC transporter D family member 1 [Hibiscus syriacus]|uniref:ABC transporter D family member 1 n=1 Tax=Hibiscus syriacus TaxID=106335 RepID=A0A6A2Y5V7_HIBSY|nr:ABC transporter D family member 1 [Hibiscus syriacus]
MARLFYHKPKFAILDECTSAVTTDMEEPYHIVQHWLHFMTLFCPWMGKEDGKFITKLQSEGEIDMTVSETDRQTDAIAVQRAFTAAKKVLKILKLEVIAASPSVNHDAELPIVPQLHKVPRVLPLRVAAMFKVLVPTVFDKQGAQLLAVAFLVVSRTWISDRIASLNGTTVKYFLEQNKTAFIRLIGVFHMANKNIDADQRITHDLEKLTTDLSGLVTGMVKPSVDILWFTWRMQLLTGRRGVAILYAYMLLGLGFLRTVAPDFGDLTSREQQLEGTFRFMHERLRTHAESVAFFGGGAREKAIVDSRFKELLDHSLLLLKKKWLFGILDDFVTKQLPHNVTWFLSLLYALEHKGDRALVSTQGELAHALRFLESVVSQSFLAFGDILELHRKFLELSGSINRVFELEELLDAAQSGDLSANNLLQSQRTAFSAKDVISFSEVDIITPAQKLLARQLTCDVVQGKSLLVTGPNGSGKSYVFRVLRGKNPADTTSILDARLKSILENVRLNYLLEREEGGWDANLNWEDMLSLGEQQRLGMARLFFHKPKFGILDECTNYDLLMARVSGNLKRTSLFQESVDMIMEKDKLLVMLRTDGS